METITQNKSATVYATAISIDEVIAQLEKNIADCIVNNSRAGYFAVLYHRVSCRIKQGIIKNEFEDNARMEKLDVLFANRYLEAWHQYNNKQNCSNCWKIAFDAVTINDSIIIQHLLLGINAHINLDLGIAAALTMKGYSLEAIQKDFNGINTILASMIDEVEDCVSKAAPLLFLLHLHTTNLDEMLVQFSINTARKGAWDFAVELGDKQEKNYEQCILARDEAISLLAISMAKPGKWLQFTIRLIHWFEKKNVAEVIMLLKG